MQIKGIPGDYGLEQHGLRNLRTIYWNLFPPELVETQADPTKKRKFTKQQVAGRLREITLLFEEGLLTDEFDHRKVRECETGR